MEPDPDKTPEEELQEVVRDFRRQYLRARVAKYAVGAFALINIGALAAEIPPDNLREGIFGAINVGAILISSIMYPHFRRKEAEFRELAKPGKPEK